MSLPTKLLLLTTVAASLFGHSLYGDITFASTTVKVAPPKPDAQAIVVEFPFKNTGGKAVEILKAEASCGCTVPEISEKAYPPGKSGVVKVRFDIGGRQGLQAKQITVQTNEGVHLLTLSVDLPQRILITPRLKIFQKGEISQVFSVVFASDAPVKTVSLGDPSPNYTAELAEKTQGSKYEVKVVLNPKAATSFSEVLYIHSKGASGIEYVDSFFIRRPEY